MIRNTFLLLYISFLLIGCASLATQKSHLIETEEMIKKGEYRAALKQIDNAKTNQYKEKDRVLYYLDSGMLNHFCGVQIARQAKQENSEILYKEAKKYLEASIQKLSSAESEIEFLYTKSISKEALSYIANDNVKEYAGEDFEDIYCNIFKALSFLELRTFPTTNELDYFDKAFVEIRSVNNKLAALEQKYSKKIEEMNKSKNSKKQIKSVKNPFIDSALARYLSLLLYRTEGALDDAKIDYKKMYEAERLQAAIYTFPIPNVKKHLEFNKNAKLNVMGFTGRGPDKKAKTLWIHTEKDLVIIASSEEYDETKSQQLNQLDAFPWFGMKAGYHFKFQLPYIEKQKSEVYQIKILANDKIVKSLAKIESLENAAVQMYKLKEPILYLKTIARAVSKGLISHKAKQKMKEQIGDNALFTLARLATDLAVDATETADLRISHFFPATAWIKEIELPEGNHHIKIQYIGKNQTLLFEDDLGMITVSKENLNFIETFYLN